MARGKLIPMFCAQDGQDFYIYKGESMTVLHTTWKAPFAVRNLHDAELARNRFKQQMILAGYEPRFPNPFAAEA